MIFFIQYLLFLAKTLSVWQKLAETCFCQAGLNRFKPLLAETCQPCCEPDSLPLNNGLAYQTWYFYIKWWVYVRLVARLILCYPRSCRSWRFHRCYQKHNFLCCWRQL